MRVSRYDAMVKSIASFGNGIPVKIFGWFFTICLIFSISLVIKLIDWNLKKENFIERYVYNENSNFYYEVDDERIYVDIIYDTDGEIIKPDVPDGKYVYMYCSKSNDKECIYINLDSNDSFDSYIFNPFGLLLCILVFFVFSTASFLIIKLADRPTGSIARMASLLFFVIGLIGFIRSLYNTFDYFKVKEGGNLVEGIVYSEVYIGYSKNYRPVVYYYVDGKKYIYVCEFHKGDFDNNKGSKIELYYDELNPGKVVEKDNSGNIMFIFLGLFLMVFGFPGLFMKKWLENKIENDRHIPIDLEWKI